jgi:hypothetical protein
VATINGRNVTTGPTTGSTDNANRLLPLQVSLDPATVDRALSRRNLVARRRARIRPQA